MNTATVKREEEAIKGIIELSHVLDLVDALPVDYMKTVLLGVTRLLLTRWFYSG